MLLTITTTHRPATDLGFLLHKNPARAQSFDLSFGRVHVFYPEASPERCTAALLLDVDSVGLVRGKHGPEGEGGLLQQYVNDRPYVASSFLSVAIARVFGSALKGESKERPDLVAAAIPLEARIAVLSCRGGEGFLRRLFEPLGYTVVAEPQPLDAKFPDWGQSRYFRVTLSATKRLSELLGHLYVLVPVLDDEKHYWVTQDDVEKLLRYGEGNLLRLLLADRQFEEIVGMDVSWRALEIATERLKLDRLAPAQRERVRLIHGSLMYRDTRLAGYDAAAVVEVIEHLDPPRLAAFERVLFEFARPATVVVTTPNAEYNVRWETLPAGRFRHRDHRFEWTREQFQDRKSTRLNS